MADPQPDRPTPDEPSPPLPDADRGSIQSIERAAMILALFDQDTRSLTPGVRLRAPRAQPHDGAPLPAVAAEFGIPRPHLRARAAHRPALGPRLGAAADPHLGARPSCAQLSDRDRAHRRAELPRPLGRGRDARRGGQRGHHRAHRARRHRARAQGGPVAGAPRVPVRPERRLAHARRAQRRRRRAQEQAELARRAARPRRLGRSRPRRARLRRRSRLRQPGRAGRHGAARHDHDAAARRPVVGARRHARRMPPNSSAP